MKIKYLVLIVKFKKIDSNTKITKTEKKLTNHDHDKYIASPEFNTVAAGAFDAKLKQGNLISKTDFDAKLSSLYRKIGNLKACLMKILQLLLQVIIASIGN